MYTHTYTVVYWCNVSGHIAMRFGILPSLIQAMACGLLGTKLLYVLIKINVSDIALPVSTCNGYSLLLLTHWGRVTHICVGKWSIIGSDNGLSPGRRQAIIWTNAGMLLIEPLGTTFSEFFIEILTFSFNQMRLKVSSAKWRPFCLGLNVLSDWFWAPNAGADILNNGYRQDRITLRAHIVYPVHVEYALSMHTAAPYKCERSIIII